MKTKCRDNNQRYNTDKIENVQLFNDSYKLKHGIGDECTGINNASLVDKIEKRSDKISRGNFIFYI